jgi:hypothetical protein
MLGRNDPQLQEKTGVGQWYLPGMIHWFRKGDRKYEVI